MMSKKQLIRTMSEKAGLSRKYAEIALDSIVAVVTDALKQGEQVVIPGFGSFQVKVRRAREGRNPISGEKIMVPEKRIPTFRPGSKLREAIPQGEAPAGDKQTDA